MDANALVSRHRFTDLNLLSLSLRLGSFVSEILGWGFFEPHWWRNYLHVHSFFEVCYAFQGEGTFRMMDTNYQVRAGEVFVAKPGEPHEIISSREEPLGIYFWSYTLLPHKDYCSDEKGIDAFLDAFLTSRRCISAYTPTMQSTLELLTEEINRKEPGYTQAIEGLVVKLLLDTARAVVDDALSFSDPVHPPIKSPEEAVVQTVVRYLKDNYSRSISLRDLAAEVHLSERHISRLFSKIMDVSIMEYLTSLRIETAAQLLLDRQLPIKEIAQRCGYPDVRHFTTLFRCRTGLTPASLRQEGGTRFLGVQCPASG